MAADRCRLRSFAAAFIDLPPDFRPRQIGLQPLPPERAVPLPPPFLATWNADFLPLTRGRKDHELPCKPWLRQTGNPQFPQLSSHAHHVTGSEKPGPKGRTIPHPLSLFLPTSFHHERRLWLRAPWFRNSEGFRNIVRQSVEIWSDPDFTRHRAGLPGPAWTSGFGNVVHHHA